MSEDIEESKSTKDIVKEVATEITMIAKFKDGNVITFELNKGINTTEGCNNLHFLACYVFMVFTVTKMKQVLKNNNIEIDLGE